MKKTLLAILITAGLTIGVGVFALPAVQYFNTDVRFFKGVADSASSTGSSGQVLSSTGTSTLWVDQTGSGSSTSSLAFNVLPTASTTISELASTTVGSAPNSIFVSGDYLYTTNLNSANLSIVDISNPYFPIEVATATVGTSPRSVFVSGNFAYVANQSTNNISIVDVSNKKSPTTVATLAVGTTPRFVYVSGRYAYVANENSNNISIVDVGDPKNPKIIATSTVGIDPYNTYVKGKYLYVANRGEASISIVDVSDPANPVHLASTTVGGSPFSIQVQGRYLYVTNQTSHTISVVDVNNPYAPVVVGTVTTGKEPFFLQVNGNYGYVTNFTSSSFQVLDFTSSTNPTVISTVQLPVGSRGTFVKGKYAYFSATNANKVAVYDLGGAEIGNLVAHNIFAGNLQTQNDIILQGTLIANTGILAGPGGILSNGSLSVYSSSTNGSSAIFSINSVQTPNILNVFSNGKIGINSSSPIASLAVQGTGGTNPFAVVSSTGSSLLTVLTNGNVGINSSTPSTQFAVNGTSTMNGLEILNGGSLTGASIRYGAANNGIYFPSAVQVFIAAGGVLSGNFYNGGMSSNDLKTGTIYAGNSSGSSDGSTLSLIANLITAARSTPHTDTSGNPTQLKIQSSFTPASGSAVFRGISIMPTITANEAATGGYSALYINPTETAINSTNTRRLIDANLASTSIFVVNADGRIGINSSSPTSLLSISSSSTYPLFTIASSTNNSVLLTVLQNGNVGINSSTPIDTLGVQGGLQVVGTGVTSTNLYASKMTGGNLTLTDTVSLTVGTSGRIYWQAGGNYIDQNGSTGNLRSTAGFEASIAAGSNGFKLNNTGARVDFGSGADDFMASNGTNVYVSSSFGIGTSTPYARLTVVGLATSSPIFDVASSTNASFFRILANGNVGINSSSPGSTISLNARSTENPFSIVSSTGVSMFNLDTSGTLTVAGTVSSSVMRMGATFREILHINQSGNYIVTPTSTVTFISVDTTNNTTTIILPDPALNMGRELFIKDPNGHADLHNLGVNYFYYVTTITNPYGSSHVISDGNGWQGL